MKVSLSQMSLRACETLKPFALSLSISPVLFPNAQRARSDNCDNRSPAAGVGRAAPGGPRQHRAVKLVDRILRLVPAGIRSKRQPSAKSPGFKRQLRSTRPQAGAGHQRRQPLRRGAVPHRQIPARIPIQGVRRSPFGQGVGHALRPLVQQRPPP